MGEPNQPQWLTVEQAQQMATDAAQAAVTEALAQHAAAQEATPSGSITAAQAQAMIDQALARQAEAHNEAIRQMASSLRGSVVTFVPYHAGGPGTEIAETWSQWEQTLARQADDAKALAAN